MSPLNRRGFIIGTAAGLAIPALAHRSGLFADALDRFVAKDSDLKGRVRKTLKIGMVGVDGSLLDKLKAVKAAGFDGIEMDSPGMDVDETKRAIAASELPVDGTVCSTHWQKTHTSPDAAVREQALADLETAIRDTHAVGGNSTLLVVGHGKDGPERKSGHEPSKTFPKRFHWRRNWVSTSPLKTSGIISCTIMTAARTNRPIGTYGLSTNSTRPGWVCIWTLATIGSTPTWETGSGR